MKIRSINCLTHTSRIRESINDKNANIINQYAKGYPIKKIAAENDVNTFKVKKIIKKNENYDALKLERDSNRANVIKGVLQGKTHYEIGYPRSVVREIITEEIEKCKKKIDIRI